MVDKYYVYYSDDFWENGGEGFEEFDSITEAEDFIVKRMEKSDRDNSRKHYEVIIEKRMQITPVEKIMRVKITRIQD